MGDSSPLGDGPNEKDISTGPTEGPDFVKEWADARVKDVRPASRREILFWQLLSESPEEVTR